MMDFRHYNGHTIELFIKGQFFPLRGVAVVDQRAKTITVGYKTVSFTNIDWIRASARSQ